MENNHSMDPNQVPQKFAVNPHMPQQNVSEIRNEQNQYGYIHAPYGNSTNTNNVTLNNMVHQNNSMDKNGTKQTQSMPLGQPEKMREAMPRTVQPANNQVSFAQMAREGALAECIYCEQRFPHRKTGEIKCHLKQHLGIRPYKCNQCNFKHWDRTRMSNTHYINMHSRRGVISEFIVDFEVEKQLADRVEEDYQEIRANQAKEFRKEPKPEKKVTPREFGLVYNEDGYNGRCSNTRYVSDNIVKARSNNQSSVLPSTPISKKIAANVEQLKRTTEESLKQMKEANVKHQPKTASPVINTNNPPKPAKPVVPKIIVPNPVIEAIKNYKPKLSNQLSKSIKSTIDSTFNFEPQRPSQIQNQQMFNPNIYYGSPQELHEFAMNEPFLPIINYEIPEVPPVEIPEELQQLTMDELLDNEF